MAGRQRFFFEVSYNGSRYHGWQFQPGQVTIQGSIEEAMNKFLPGFEGITGSGRTDTGVHCEQQFFHADIPNHWQEEDLRFKLNRMLPPDIAIISVRKVIPGAHARFDAFRRSYEYRITRRKDPFKPSMSYWFERPLNLLIMNEAAQLLLKHENFESFSRVRTEVNHFLCNITKAEWAEYGHLLVFQIEANRFLRGMVRAIVGSLIEVGEGKRSVSGFEEMIISLDRRAAGPAAPPEGLFLTGVWYPEDIFPD